MSWHSPSTRNDSGTATQTAFWQYDDEQAIDIYSHDLYYNTTSYPGIMTAMNGVVSAYNAKYGENVKLYGYEGGIGCAAPALSASLTAAVDAVTTSFPVDAPAGFIAGTPILIQSEWCVIASVAGNTLTVNRGQFGTTAAAHASGTSLRPAYIERSHDLIYNPNWYFAEQDLIGYVQQNGFAQLNQYALSMGGYGNAYFGAYLWQTQDHGRGDGSDGKANNRLTLACPGKPNSKAPTVNQDMVNVSVRGQAFIDWMGALGAAPPSGKGGKPHRLVFPRRAPLRAPR